MPRAFYDDWVRVAAEETKHFGLLRGWLNDRGSDYGDYPAHDGLWRMAVKTADDVLKRMALVPRLLEARGLDVTPAMIAKLECAGEDEAAGMLAIIYEEEIGHVAIGTRWFHHCCNARGLEPEATYFDLLRAHAAHALPGGLNIRARLAAGFSASELQRLEALAWP